MKYIVIVLSLIFLDQITKYQINSNFTEGETLPIILGKVHLTYVKNRGVAFGLFQGKLDLISIVTFIIIIFLIYYVYKNMKLMSKLEKLGYLFIIGGALGNIIDRIYHGFVIDMIDFRMIWDYIFNLADVWINIGIILLIIDSFLNNKKNKN